MMTPGRFGKPGKELTRLLALLAGCFRSKPGFALGRVYVQGVPPLKLLSSLELRHRRQKKWRCPIRLLFRRRNRNWNTNVVFPVGRLPIGCSTWFANHSLEIKDLRRE